jgi:D-alanyl-D-alanine carboxypeptidase (penicillin-binding protein 5/6)
VTSARRPRYALRRTVVAAAVLLVGSAAVYGPVTLSAALPEATAVVHTPTVPSPAAAALDLPTAGSAGIALRDSTTLLGSEGNQGTVPIASITKVITALVLLDAKPIEAGESGPNITVSATDVELLQATMAEGGSYELLSEGQVFSEHDMIEIMLVVSANNYAQTLTNWAFGSQAAYLTAAHSFLQSHGLTATTVADSSGLDPGSSSSVPDLLAIANLALDNPVLAAIVSTQQADFSQVGTVVNSNKLLGQYGISGIKTGTTDEAGYCLLFTSTFTVADHTFTLVGVVLGEPSSDALYDAVARLLTSAQKGYSEVNLVKSGDVLGNVTTAWGEASPVVATADASAVVWSNAPISSTITTAPVTVGDSGSQVGTIEFTVNGSTISVPLALESPLTDPGAWWKLTNPGAQSPEAVPVG